DASHLATDSLQLVIDSSLLPLREGANIMNALSDGEDYELLFCCNEDPPEMIGDCPITKIGHVSKRRSGDPLVIDEQGNDISHFGWKHEQ
ncbi:MAG: hypothetical protein QF444_04670, partial [Phycisphaerales bacterium]|nr:hypothetical protein [Phycisphaerales bacterium]